MKRASTANTPAPPNASSLFVRAAPPRRRKKYFFRTNPATHRKHGSIVNNMNPPSLHFLLDIGTIVGSATPSEPRPVSGPRPQRSDSWNTYIGAHTPVSQHRE